MKNVDMFIKRTVCVLFVLLTLSVGLFAGFSGTTGMTLSYDFDDNSFGFDGKNTSAKFDFNLLGVSDISGGDGSVKAQVEAYLTLDYSFENTNFAGKDGFNFSLGDVRGQFRIEDASVDQKLLNYYKAKHNLLLIQEALMRLSTQTNNALDELNRLMENENIIES